MKLGEFENSFLKERSIPGGYYSCLVVLKYELKKKKYGV